MASVASLSHFPVGPLSHEIPTLAHHARPRNLVSQARQGKDDKLDIYPQRLSSTCPELCWSGQPASFGPSDYVINFSADELRSIDEAVTFFQSLHLDDVARICPDNFPLPQGLAKRLRGVSETLHRGRGFAVLRGLKPRNQSDEYNVVAFAGISSYVGRDRSADSNGIAMEHLRDATRDPKTAGRDTADLHPTKVMSSLKFHADRPFGDILALFVKSQAAIGGTQYLASSFTVFEKIRNSHPEALRVLVDEFPWPGVRDGMPHLDYSPVFFQKEGRVLCQVVYRIFEGTNLLSEKQWKALRIFEQISNEHSIELDVHPGDIQFVNNLGLLHARRSWIDRPGRERHYYRMGIRDPDQAWARPDGYEAIFDDSFNMKPEDQFIPVTDVDPHGLASLERDQAKPRPRPSSPSPPKPIGPRGHG